MRLFWGNSSLPVRANKKSISRKRERLPIPYQRSTDISSREKIVSEITSEMVKIASSVFMSTMQKAASMPNMYGETQDITWTCRPLGEIPNGPTNVSTPASIHPTTVSAYRTGHAAIISTASRVSIPMTTSDVSLSKNTIIAS